MSTDRIRCRERELRLQRTDRRPAQPIERSSSVSSQSRPKSGHAGFVSANHPREMRTNIFHSAIKVTKPVAIALFSVCPVQAAFRDRLERRSETPALREDRQMPTEWQTGSPKADRLVRRLTGLRPPITVTETAL